MEDDREESQSPAEESIEPAGEDFRAGFVALVGRPSAGKSTLLNRLCGNKVSIISPKPQTTRNLIRGIVNRPSFQIVFLDTPGFTSAEDLRNQKLRQELFRALKDADAAVYLVDSSRAPGKEEQGILEIVKQFFRKRPESFVCVLNKNDLADSEKHAGPLLGFLDEKLGPVKRLSISAKRDPDFEDLLQEIASRLPKGDLLYDPGIETDQEPTFRISELIREQALAFCGQELPYAMYVEVADLEYRDEPLARKSQDSRAADELEGRRHLWVRAFLQVERESQKGILIGAGAKRIKEIRRRSTKEIRRQFGCPVYLDLQVKVNYKWRRR